MINLGRIENFLFLVYVVVLFKISLSAAAKGRDSYYFQYFSGFAVLLS
jgi:hypothetical protein